MFDFNASLLALSTRLRSELGLRFRQVCFGAGFLFAFSPWASPAIALTLGIALALSLENPFSSLGSRASGFMLRIGVVLLGFGMSLPKVLEVGRDGALMAAVTIAATMLLGFALGRGLKVDPRTSTLISAGTAVCGGSAIAAMAAVIGAVEGEIAVALGTVFLLNAVALYVFPLLGEFLNMAPDVFGMWAGIAIHDLSSVVGAASQFGSDALQIATAVKLSRTLWIVPLAFVATAWIRSTNSGAGESAGSDANSKIRPPYFILLFLLASLSRELSPTVEAVAPTLALTAKAFLTAALFVIGAGISPAALRQVGWQPMVQGLVLWIFISSTALGATLYFGGVAG